MIKKTIKRPMRRMSLFISRDLLPVIVMRERTQIRDAIVILALIREISSFLYRCNKRFVSSAKKYT